MRYFFFLSLIIPFLPLFLTAQDVIIKKNGKEINCEVLDESPETIKYRRYIDGPIFKISMDKVSKINYGIVDSTRQMVKDTMPLQFSKNLWGVRIKYGDDKLNNMEVKELMKDQPEALKQFVGGKTINAIGGILGFSGGFMLAWELGRYLNTHEVNAAVLAIGGTFFVSSILMDIAGTSKIKKSVVLYNQSLKKPSDVSFRFGLTTYGIGLSLKF